MPLFLIASLIMDRIDSPEKRSIAHFGSAATFPKRLWYFARLYSEEQHRLGTEKVTPRSCSRQLLQKRRYPILVVKLVRRAILSAGSPQLSTLMASSSSNVVGVHYRVGKKIGEGSFGVIFEGTNLLNNNQVAIKFVRLVRLSYCTKLILTQCRNRERVMPLNFEMNTERTKYWLGVVSASPRIAMVSC